MDRNKMETFGGLKRSKICMCCSRNSAVLIGPAILLDKLGIQKL